MAYTFSKTPNHSYLRTTTGPPQWGTGTPTFSVSAWFRVSNVTEAHAIIRLEHIGENTRYVLYAAGKDTYDPVKWFSQTGGNIYTASMGSFSADTWHHVLGTAGGSTVKLALDGAQIMAEAAAEFPDDDESYVQIGGDNVFIPAPTGSVAEVAIYNIDLSAASYYPARLALAKGYSPACVFPQNLIFYAPLVRDLQDVKAGHTLTAYNSPTVGEHCPVRRPANSFPAPYAPYVPPVTGSSWYYNRKRLVA